jgi:hypothetical protein
MKKLFFLLITSALVYAAQAQVLTPSVLASTGAFAVAAGHSFSYTVGEMAAVETYTSSSVILTQGFQQPDDILNGLLDIEKDADGAFSIYPIPATGHLWFGYEYSERGHVDVAMYDMTGRQLDFTFSEGYETGKSVHSFDCSAYAAGNYMLSARFTTGGGHVKMLTKKFQIIN